MSKRNETTPQDARKRRIAEALRHNLKRRKLQARGRAARSERATPDGGEPTSAGKPDR